VRLEQLTGQVGDRVAVEWRSYLLRPEPREPSLEKFRAYTQSWLRPASMAPEVSFVPWATENPQPSHSLPSAVAGKVAASFGPQAWDRYHLALMRAYFTDNRTISETEVQVDVARDCGLDPDEFARRLAVDGEELTAQVRQEHAAAMDQMVTAVPTVLVNDVLPIPGAQELDVYVNVVERIAARAT
jgi:predicted DsbA family dithiol-disulfide isomerase